MITAVIPVHNRADLLERMLETLRGQTMPVAETIVVDNASSDGAREIARRFGCRVIALTENRGFARAVNLGWQSANTPWVAILNSDVELDSRWLEYLLAGAGEASFATGLILDAAARESVDGTYDLVTRAGCAWRAGHGEARGAQTAMNRRIAIAPGTACLYRTEVLRALGGLEERFGSYLEDVDLGLRCWQAGLSGVYVPAALAWHHGSATLGRWDARVVRLIARNQLRLVARHYDRETLRACWWPIVAGQLLWGLVALRHGAGLAWAAGKWEGWREFQLEGRGGPALREFLNESEREIRERAGGTYWRWYIALTQQPRQRSGEAD